jgi:hypothetical protein
MHKRASIGMRKSVLWEALNSSNEHDAENMNDAALRISSSFYGEKNISTKRKLQSAEKHDLLGVLSVKITEVVIDSGKF